MKSVSLVIPCYQAGPSIVRLIERCMEARQDFDLREIILVDDGSQDDTWTQIQKFKDIDILKACRLLRNYGEHLALRQGIRIASSEIIATIDDDLQHDPKEIPLLLKKIEEGHDLVYGQYQSNQHPTARKVMSLWNGWCTSAIYGRPMGLHLSSFRAMKSELAKRATKENCNYIDASLLRQKPKIGTAPVSHQKSMEIPSRYSSLSLLNLHTKALGFGANKETWVREFLHGPN